MRLEAELSEYERDESIQRSLSDLSEEDFKALCEESERDVKKGKCMLEKLEREASEDEVSVENLRPVSCSPEEQQL